MDAGEEAPLLRWGFGEAQRKAWSERAASDAQPGVPGRVASEHKGGLFVATAKGERLAAVTGKLRRAAQRGQALVPAVGDWVALGDEPGGSRATILAVLPRQSVLQRRAAGEREVAQTLAANVDAVLLFASLGAEVNPRRLERALAVVRESGAQPILVMSKADLCGAPEERLAAVRALAAGAPALAISAVTGAGLTDLQALLLPGRTAALLGPSGTGKSTLVNRWLGNQSQAIGAVDAVGKGRHTTTHRELIPLSWGALVIDTPGLRELGLWESGEGVREVFDDVAALAPGCRFSDCAHDSEPGCAVRAAVEAGALAEDRWQGFLKLRRELEVQSRRTDARSRAEAKLRDKEAQRRMNEIIRTRKS